MVYTYIYKGILFSDEEEWNNAMCGNMHGPRIIILSEISQKERNIWYHLYVEAFKNDAKELIHEAEIDPQT